jgi:hypothetical protein
MKDRVDYVRRAAYMAMAMVLIQHNKTQTAKVKEVCEIYTKAIDNKHVDVMTKMGAIIAFARYVLPLSDCVNTLCTLLHYSHVLFYERCILLGETPNF